MATTLAEQVVVDASGPDEFVSRAPLDRMGNAANIAYGGCAIAIAIQAAFQTVRPGYLPYSAMGNFLGPALIDRPLRCSVRRLRDTRTFATRQVDLTQKLDDGSSRMCMVILADFQVREKASLFEYSAPPRRTYSPAEKCPDTRALAKAMVAKGQLSGQVVELFSILFALKERFTETRMCPEGVSGQNLSGMAEATTDQDHLRITDKTSANWTRARHPVPQASDKFAALGFLMDESLSFLPLTHTNRAIHDAGACSSLDFALRFFTGDFDLTRWHLREWNTVTGRDGRTYSQARMWDEEGNMVVEMTQQSIMRPKPGQVKANL